MEAEAEKAEETQEKGDLDDRFLVYAEDGDWGIIQLISSTGNVLVYTGHKGSRPGRFYRRPIPKDTFFTLIREVLRKFDAGEIAVEVE